MELRQIATISGKPGLYRVFKPAKNGVIIESIDEKKAKTIVSSTHKVSILQEVSIYTNTQEGSIPLGEVFNQIHLKYAGNLPVQPNADNNTLLKFMEEILPDYDKSKVYPSDVKKLISWYNILAKHATETLENLNLPQSNNEENVEVA
jgi:hypothetical protein